LLARAAGEFPPDTVFVAVVDPGVGTERRSIVVKTNTGHLYVGPDNGLFTEVIHDQGLDRAWEITNASLLRPGALSQTFHGRDIYGPIGGRLAAGLDPAAVGALISDPVLLPFQKPSCTNDLISGQALYIDHYGNITTNIPADWLDNIAAEKMDLVTVELNNATWQATVVRTYAEVSEGSLLVLANSEGRLEIARNLSSAADLLKAQVGCPISIHK